MVATHSAAIYDRVLLLEVPCPVCRCAKSSDLATEFGIAIARCAACGLVYTRTPLRDSQGHYSAGDDFMRAKYEPILSGAVPHPRTSNYHEHLALLEEITSGRDLLDVGAHCGFLLDVARQRGWNTTGVEPSEVTSALARERLQLDVRTGTIATADLPTGGFDVVTLVDVFEHIGEPRRLLAEVATALRPGGRLFVKVPNFRYLTLKRRLLAGTRVVEEVFDAKEHLVHYSLGTLCQTLRTSGFEIELTKVPSPIQAGAAWRRAVRAAGPVVARRLPGGSRTPLATDIVAVARSWVDRT